MNALVWYLLIVCLSCLSATSEDKKFRPERHEDENSTRQIFDNQGATADSEQESTEDLQHRNDNEDDDDDDDISAGYNTDQAEARSILNGIQKEDEDVDSMNRHAAFQKRAKPLKNIFMGIYKNYKSTYLGNRTSQEYKNSLRDRIAAASIHKINSAASKIETSSLKELQAARDQDHSNETNFIVNFDSENEEINHEKSQEIDEKAKVKGGTKTSLEYQLRNSPQIKDLKPAEDVSEKQSKYLVSLKKKRRKHKNARTSKRPRKQLKVEPPAGGDDPLVHAADNEYRYQLGSGLNLSLDMSNDIVSVKLDGGGLRELIAGRWLDDHTEQGRGKKYDMMTKVLPLFILPFLIQSAIVPFVVTKLKLLVINSILVGKLAIFLLIISAFRNSNKMMQTYEVAPSYWAGEPSRRSEVPGTASSSPYSGYRVDGKPAAWIN